MRWFLLGFLSFVPAQIALAASLYIDPASTTMSRGDSIKMAVRLDTDEAAGECVNAIDATISYDPSIQPVDISRGGSIFSIWVEEPIIDQEARTISFAGGLPNGYCGRIEGDPRLSNVIVEIVFRSPGLQIGGGSEANSATVAVSPDSIAYLNDGLGTAVPLRAFASIINLERSAGAEIIDPWREQVQTDTTPPQQFSIELVRDDKAFNGEYFIVFNTADKETGISHYEVMEEPVSNLGRFSWGRADAPWVETRSPFVLTDQSLNSIIRVRALDKAGNEYIATLIPEESLQTLSHDRFMIYVLAGLSAVLLITLATFSVLWYRRRKSVREMSTASGNIEVEAHE
jgi:hypothetical protein